ncbi:hypothetical protein MTBBW1_2030029 [Desulfamplus magnetovallimortis]|uniref:Uncharacterized protein n=1 Tax=Desulfamplus magnetovallimortis TaxID=1246637 RepID=A0A1W1HBW8_9BACT|nr:hypothetical protein [Desulfamplus magnetovallimortis]SLM29939.1 hypothetical protein MTBBW1_2030029 [Desulfamplus magnetovallimortis]
MPSRRERASVSISLFSFQDIITCLSGIMILLVLLISLDLVNIKFSDTNSRKSSFPDSPSSEDTIPSYPENHDNNSPAVATLQSMAIQIIEKMEKGIMPDSVDMARLIVEMEYAESSILAQKEVVQKDLLQLNQDAKDAEKTRQDLEKKENFLKQTIAELQSTLDNLSKDNILTLIPEKGESEKPLMVECSGEKIRRAGFGRNSLPESFPATQSGIESFLESLSMLKKSDQYLLLMIKPSASDYAMELVDEIRKKNFDVGYDVMMEDQRLSFQTLPDSQKTLP